MPNSSKTNIDHYCSTFSTLALIILFSVLPKKNLKTNLYVEKL